MLEPQKNDHFLYCLLRSAPKFILELQRSNYFYGWIHDPYWNFVLKLQLRIM